MVYQSGCTVAVAPVRLIITIWSRAIPAAVRKLPVTIIRSPAGVTPDSRGPIGALAPEPVLWWSATVMSMNGSSAPVVALRVTSWPWLTPAILVKKPPMNSRLFGSISIVSMPPLVDGALNDVTAWPVFTLSSWMWLGPLLLILVKSPAT